MTNIDHNTYMAMAYAQAELAKNQDEVPIGAVVVDTKTSDIIGVGRNQTIELSDPSAHAEMQAIRAACGAFGSQRIPDCTLYVTLEPCAMCAAAISYARIAHVYYGASDPKSGGICQGPKIYDHATIHHKPQVTGGIMADECSQILKDFFKIKRDSKR